MRRHRRDNIPSWRRRTQEHTAVGHSPLSTRKPNKKQWNQISQHFYDDFTIKSYIFSYSDRTRHLANFSQPIAAPRHCVSCHIFVFGEKNARDKWHVGFHSTSIELFCEFRSGYSIRSFPSISVHLCSVFPHLIRNTSDDMRVSYLSMSNLQTNMTTVTNIGSYLCVRTGNWMGGWHPLISSRMHNKCQCKAFTRLKLTMKYS